MDRIDYEREIFARMFRSANALQVYLDRLMNKDGLTAKQMFLMIAVDSFGQAYPTFKDVAKQSGSSYQNVKQIAIKLEEKGYLKIATDEKDARARRLILTPKAYRYWADRDEEDLERMNQMFTDYNMKELENFLFYLTKMEQVLSDMGKE